MNEDKSKTPVITASRHHLRNSIPQRTFARGELVTSASSLCLLHYVTSQLHIPVRAIDVTEHDALGAVHSGSNCSAHPGVKQRDLGKSRGGKAHCLCAMASLAQQQHGTG